MITLGKRKFGYPLIGQRIIVITDFNMFCIHYVKLKMIANITNSAMTQITVLISERRYAISVVAASSEALTRLVSFTLLYIV